MNRLIVRNHQISKNDDINISDEAILNHLNNVLKLKENSSIKLCLLDTGLGEGIITKINSKNVEIKITKRFKGTSPLCHLQVALSRPPTIKKILEHGSSLGVGQFDFFKAELSEKSYLNSKVFEKADSLCELGLAQSGIYYQKPEIKKSLQLDLSKHKQKFFLTFNTNQTLRSIDINFENSISLAIGPERGWTKKEENFLIENEYQPLSIGPSILRVEIAIFALLGQLHLIKTAK